MRNVFIIIAILLSLPILAQKVRTVEGEYIYHAPKNITTEVAQLTALERAKIQALADEFGTVVTQNNSSRIVNQNGHSETDFLSLGSSDVKGEWIETIGEPKYEIRVEDGHIVVVCHVKGKAREIMSAAIDLKFKVLCNGTEDKFENNKFRNNDDIYLAFQSPVKGYLAVYLEDADGQVSCLLPYRNQTQGIYQIDANHRYLFFNQESAPITERGIVDEYIMQTTNTSEFNQLHIIFSPNQFTKASDQVVKESLPRQMSRKEFLQWLAKCRKYDKDMTVKRVDLIVEQ